MPATTRNQTFTAVQPVGALLPKDMLERIREGKDAPGSTPSDYGIVGAASVRDEAERHWDYLKGAWRVLRDKLQQVEPGRVQPDPTGLALANWLEPLFAELGFGRIRSLGSAGLTSDDATKTFRVSHRWEHVPIHLTAWDCDLDRRPGPGQAPPQSLVQELLNRSEPYLWAVLSNGRQLRLLRDSASLVTASYVEFDLEAIFDGELFSDFVLLYRLLHVSRFATSEGASPATCWLEKWRIEAIDSGTRALEQLRGGVQRAITSLGTGFTSHPANTDLRANLDTDLMKKALLRLVYRLLFLFVAEDRDLLIPADADPKARERYERFFSTARLRETARRRQGSTHGDRWVALRVVLDGLRNDEGFPPLGLPGLGGIFEHNAADAVVEGLALTNEALSTAVRALSIVWDPAAKRNRVVDYQHLGAEELGSIYESLLELVPKYDPSDRSFRLVELAGNERKTTGSYYTPTSLIDCLLDSALDPVLDDAQKRGEQTAAASDGTVDVGDAIAKELLGVTVCDPACGSGHFLVAAARRIAKRLAAVREQNPEPTMGSVRTALREVVANCIYGVDLNEMAVELAKVSLWLEALEPGKPLGFMDAHIKLGNSLLGATPVLLEGGIPDGAFKPIEGDDKKWVARLKKENAAERSGQDSLFDLHEDVKVTNVQFAADLRRITRAKADTLVAVRQQVTAFHNFEQSAEYVRDRHVADAWCAAFVWEKIEGAPPAVTQSVFRALRDPDSAGVSARTNAEVVRLAKDYSFFHWHLEFPEVFQVAARPGPNIDESTGWSGGFSCVLGNPPWEKVELKEQEFFAQRDAQIATATNATARKKLIAELAVDRPELADEFSAARRRSEGESHFLRSSQRYPLTGSGRVNTYAVFAETVRCLVSTQGRCGVVLPIGIGTDATTAPFFSDLVRKRKLISFLGFENEGYILSRDVHHSVNFCLLAMAGRDEDVRQTFFSSKVRYMEELADRRFAISPDDILLVNPNTGTSPMFRTQRDADITVGIYRRVPVLVKEGDPHGNPWGVRFSQGLFNMASDSGLFRTREQLERDGWSLNGNVFARSDARMLPLYEAKMLHHYDHRFGTYEGQTEAQANMGTLPRLTIDQHDDPEVTTLPRYWVAESEIDTTLASRRWNQDWLLEFRKVTNTTNERTALVCIFPKGGLGDSGNLLMPNSPSNASLLCAITSTFVFDYVLRQKMGGTNLNFFQFEQLPVLTSDQIANSAFINSRVFELSYTAYDMEPFARDLGHAGAPFRWDEERRALMRAELDALFFHLYGIARDDVDYIMQTFPIVKRKDISRYGTYRTKDHILQIYDAMAAANASGTEYQTILSPAPGHGPRHPARKAV